VNTTDDICGGLPGEHLVRKGFEDLKQDQFSIPACLVSIARTRLCSTGIFDCEGLAFIADPEHALYAQLKREDGDAYSRYNSLIRELVSFEQALDHRLSSIKG